MSATFQLTRAELEQRYLPSSSSETKEDIPGVSEIP
jgi:hypothetical protein